MRVSSEEQRVKEMQSRSRKTDWKEVINKEKRTAKDPRKKRG